MIFLTLLSLCKVTAHVNLDSLWGVWNDTAVSDTSRLNAIETIARDVYLPKILIAPCILLNYNMILLKKYRIEWGKPLP